MQQTETTEALALRLAGLTQPCSYHNVVFSLDYSCDWCRDTGQVWLFGASTGVRVPCDEHKEFSINGEWLKTCIDWDCSGHTVTLDKLTWELAIFAVWPDALVESWKGITHISFPVGRGEFANGHGTGEPLHALLEALEQVAKAMGERKELA